MKRQSLRTAPAAGAFLFLGAAPAVVASSAVLDVGGTPVGVAVGADGTAYVGNYDRSASWAWKRRPENPALAATGRGYSSLIEP